MSAIHASPHLEIDAAGNVRIAGTRYDVAFLIEEHLTHGWSPEEMNFQHPDLTMGQIHSALAYYHDNRETMDAKILAEDQEYHRQREAHAESSLVRRMRTGSPAQGP